MIYIGIDPGRNTGVAEWSPHEKVFVNLTTTDFWGAIKIINNYFRGGGAFKVLIENPGLNKPVFPKGSLTEPMKLRIAQDVGRNKEDAYLIIEWCKLKEIEHHEIQPTTAKWTHRTFINYTKLDLKKSNEHVRDAARLVWGL